MPISMMGARPMAVSAGRPVQVDDETAFAGGLNIVAADDALAANQFRRGENGRLTIFGAFAKRGGTQRTAGALIAATPVQNGAPWNKANGTTLISAIAGGTLFTTSYAAFPLTWTQRGSTGALSSTVAPSFASFISGTTTETMYIADGGLLNKLTGTTLTTNLATTPSCTQLAVHNERLWGCGDSSFPDSIFYSNLDDGDSLGVGAAGGGQIIVRTFGAENCVTVRSLGTSLLIVHPRGISRLTGYGQSDITVTPAGITKDVGSIAPFSPVVVDNVMFFLSERGLYAATEADVTPVNTPDTPDPLSVLLPTLSAATIANIRVVFNRATLELEIHIPGLGMYLYHTILKAWAGPWSEGYLNPETTCLFEAVNVDGFPIILRGDAQGFVSETDRPSVTLDNVAADGTGGTLYTMTLQCRRLYCSDPHTAKAWRYGYLLANLNGSNSTTVTFLTDSTVDAHQLPPSTSGQWGSGTWGAGTWGSVSQVSYRQPMAGQGYYVDVVVTDSGSALPVFSQVKVAGFLLGRR